MNIVCNYYTMDPIHFSGCPGLDFQGDEDECGECKYRLSEVCRAVKTAEVKMKIECTLSELERLQEKINKIRALCITPAHEWIQPSNSCRPEISMVDRKMRSIRAIIDG